MRNERQVRRQRGTQISNVVTPTKTSRIRCAIYTRKSTEEGLDQAFNSLDAQREACAAYILSQRHEGWVGVPDLYVEAGRVDVIVVYKVDRLTRALSSRTLRRSLMSLMRSM
jgi:DNA invertase Pin-like site-specific DNA recombinase